MSISQIGSLIGGLGLFILGMRLLTTGLKEAAGQSLKSILSKYTGTKLKGVLSGTLITTLVQSSSAVTVATIGFVNANLMDLSQAIYILYGANIGTTFTGWVVALVGFHLDIKAFALPAIGVGMALRAARGKAKLGMLGEALAGFGVFFLGVEVLKNTFTVLGSDFQLQTTDSGFSSIIIYFVIGFIMTVLMQSSSAVLAIVLTSAGAGVLPLTSAAAITIGANVGTTSTAALAVIGATTNAKRLAYAQIIFNLLTGLVALFVLDTLLSVIIFFQEFLAFRYEPASILAAFDTVFNILGVLLIWPFTGYMVKFLERNVRPKKDSKRQIEYLDRTVIKTPGLALTSTLLELKKVSQITYNLAEDAIGSKDRVEESLAEDHETIHVLEEAIAEYLVGVQKNDLSEEIAGSLPLVLRVMGYLREVADLSLLVAKSQVEMEKITLVEVEEKFEAFKSNIIVLLSSFKEDIFKIKREKLELDVANILKDYEDIKQTLLLKASRGEIKASALVDYLEVLSNIKRIVERSVREVDYLCQIFALEPNLLVKASTS